MTAPAPQPDGQQPTVVMRKQQPAQNGETLRKHVDPAARTVRRTTTIGMVLGVAALYWAVRHGLLIRLPVTPSFIGAFLGFLLELAIMAGLGILVAHVIRTRHRRMARYAGAQTVAGARVAGQHARRLHGWAGTRWQERNPAAPPAGNPPASVPGQPDQAPVIVIPVREFGTTAAPGLEITQAGQMCLAAGQGEPAVEIGGDWRFRGPQDTEPVSVRNIRRVLCAWPLADVHERAHGPGCRCEIWQLTHQAGAPVPAVRQEEGNQMAAPSRVDVPIHSNDQYGRTDDHAVTECSPTRCGREPVAWPRAAPAPSRVPAQRGPRGAVPAEWAPLVFYTNDFEAGDETDILDWMGNQTNGMIAYAEAVTHSHEHHTSATIRLDKTAMAAWHDYCDALADAAAAMAKALANFKQVYEGPREFVASGGDLPRDGDFLTGED